MDNIITSSTSSTITVDDTSSRDVIEFDFVLENGKTGVISVSDELLDTEERAEARAIAEFLQNAYKKKTVRFETFRTDININDIVSIEGMLFIAKDVTIAITKKSMIATILALRYEE